MPSSRDIYNLFEKQLLKVVSSKPVQKEKLHTAFIMTVHLV